MKFKKPVKPDKATGSTPLKKSKVVRILGKGFFIVFFVLASYLLIMGIGMAIPIFVSYVFRSFGYTLETTAEALLGGAAALFFLAWIFVISLLIVKKLWRFFSGQIKKLNE